MRGSSKGGHLSRRGRKGKGHKGGRSSAQEQQSRMEGDTGMMDEGMMSEDEQRRDQY